MEFARRSRSPLEKLENLEQLRAIEHGDSIVVATVDEPSIGIDTADDYREFVRRMAA
jgi:3-deoxy-manno-octulosonate cytidylyltransferase (CMP-KDO synthetase)